MNQLEHLKAWADDLYSRTCLGETPYKREETIPIIVEHTHTQTIQSVRERIEALGDLWVLEKTAEETDSGCPKFTRINRQLNEAICGTQSQK